MHYASHGESTAMRFVMPRMMRAKVGLFMRKRLAGQHVKQTRSKHTV